MTVDEQYAGVVRACLAGDEVVTRNSRVRRATAVKVVFDSTPLVSVRKTAWRLALREWEWFQSGSSNVADLHPSVRHWWRPWADPGGVVRYNYSRQLRRYNAGFDQLDAFVRGVRDHPHSRRNLLTTWNPEEMAAPDCPITNCHNTVTQAFVGGGGGLSLVTYQRSADVVCGLPHNWIQTAAFHLWLAAQAGRPVGTLTWVGGDVHVYEQHFGLAGEILARVGECGPTPTLRYTAAAGGFRAEDFDLVGEYRPVIEAAAEMVV